MRDQHECLLGAARARRCAVRRAIVLTGLGLGFPSTSRPQLGAAPGQVLRRLDNVDEKVKAFPIGLGIGLSNTSRRRCRTVPGQVLRRLDNVDEKVKAFFAPAATAVLDNSDAHNALAAALAALSGIIEVPKQRRRGAPPPAGSRGRAAQGTRAASCHRLTARLRWLVLPVLASQPRPSKVMAGRPCVLGAACCLAPDAYPPRASHTRTLYGPQCPLRRVGLQLLLGQPCYRKSLSRGLTPGACAARAACCRRSWAR